MQYQWSFNLLVVFVLTGCGGGGGGSDTAPDTTAPTVKSTAPSSAQTAVGRNIVVSVLFSESMNGTTINPTTLTLIDNAMVPVAGGVSYDGIRATFIPSVPLLENTTYTATVTTGVQDIAGNALASNLDWSFTTGVDGTSPTVMPGTPSSAQVNVARNITVTAIFSEPMDSATINTSTFTLENSIGTPVPGAVSYTGVTATFTPIASLAAFETYTATLTTGAQDLSGNAIVSNQDWLFTTETAAVEVSWARNPETAVNRSGGGYKVYYSSNTGFNPGDGGVTEVDVPYVSGALSPTSVLIGLGSGTHYLRIAAYSALNAPGTSGGSISTAAPQVTLTVP